MTLLARTLSTAHQSLQTAARIIPPSRFATILTNFSKHTDFWACAALSTWGLAHGARRSYDMYMYPPCEELDKVIHEGRKDSSSPQETGRKVKEAIDRSPSALPRTKSVSDDLMNGHHTPRSAAKELYALPTGRTWGKPAGLLFFGVFFAVCAYSLRPVNDLNPLLARI